MVPLDRALVSSYRLSTVIMSLFITRLISPVSWLAVCKISAIWWKGNIFKFGVEQRWGRKKLAIFNR